MEFEHNDLVKLYIDRDEDMKLDKKQLIQNHMKKLGYDNINFNDKLEKNIKHNYKMNIHKLEDISYNDYKLTFCQSDEYVKICDYINNQIKRSDELTKFIGTDMNKDFYTNCTIEELEYLGF